MAMWAMGTASVIGELTFGIGNFVSQALIYAFFEWRRKAELSADRASLLVMDELTPVMSLMMQVSGGCQKYAHECSLQEFISQSEKYQALDDDGLNQVYKFLMYSGSQGMMLSHPFPVDRLHYLRAWANSAQYQQIRQGNYQRSPQEGAVNVPSTTPQDEIEHLQQQITELQTEIDRLKRV
jgi:Zn-dependent protease with chaperone function